MLQLGFWVSHDGNPRTPLTVTSWALGEWRSFSFRVFFGRGTRKNPWHTLPESTQRKNLTFREPTWAKVVKCSLQMSMVNLSPAWTSHKKNESSNKWPLKQKLPIESNSISPWPRLGPYHLTKVDRKDSWKSPKNNCWLLTFFLEGDEEMKSEKSRGIWKTTFWVTNSSVQSAILYSFLITQSVPHLMAKVQNISDGNRGRAAGDKDRIAAGSSNHHQPLFQRRRRKEKCCRMYLSKSWCISCYGPFNCTLLLQVMRIFLNSLLHD